MSKARSPRDVCSTTMGTRGLMVLALFSLVGPYSCRRSANGLATARESLPTAFFRNSRCVGRRYGLGAGSLRTGGPDRLFDPPRVLLVGGPQLVARAGLLDRQGARVLGDEV